MEQKNTAITPDQVFEVIVRYKWLIIVPLCISLTVGLISSLVAKRTYQASTTILVQPQKVATQYVQSIVSSDLDRRLSTISEQILSRSNLEKIIDEFGLYEENTGMYLEDKITSMRRRVNVKIAGSRKGTEVFYVSFKGGNPERVMRIANTLASYFIDENLKVREAQAVGTSEFLDSELQKIKVVLEKREKTLSEYRSKYLGGLPNELESNLRTLDRLQLQLSEKQNVLRDLKNSVNTVNSQISRIKQIQKESLSGNYQVDDSGKVNIIKSETELLYELEKRKLEESLLKYTEKHPDIVKLTKSVKKLKEKIETEKKGSERPVELNNEEKGSSRAQRKKPATKADNALFEQQLLSNKLNYDIKKVESGITQIQTSMAFYQKMVENTPKREQELQSLQRDYNNINENYNSLLSRKLESEIAVNMEKKQKGEQFRILDHARLPEKPISPDIRKLFLLSLAIGLGLGGGIAVMLEFFDTSIKSAEQMEAEFGLPILISIPSLKKPGKKFIKKLEIVFFSLFALYAIFVFSLFAVILYKGVDRAIIFLKMQSSF